MYGKFLEDLVRMTEENKKLYIKWLTNKKPESRQEYVEMHAKGGERKR